MTFQNHAIFSCCSQSMHRANLQGKNFKTITKIQVRKLFTLKMWVKSACWVTPEHTAKQWKPSPPSWYFTWTPQAAIVTLPFPVFSTWTLQIFKGSWLQLSLSWNFYIGWCFILTIITLWVISTLKTRIASSLHQQPNGKMKSVAGTGPSDTVHHCECIPRVQ